MGWKATGRPTVRRQRDRWVIRVDGIDTETGKHRPRQLGTYPVAASRVGGDPGAGLEEQPVVRETPFPTIGSRLWRR